jgi:hypothetical protein
LSRRTVYSHENALGIERLNVTKRVGTAPAAAPHFIKVFDAQQEYVGVFDESYDAIQVAARSGGTVWGWQQWPSIRKIAGAENAHV